MSRNSRYATLLVVTTVVVLLSTAAIAGDHEYVGVKKCKTCHLKEWKSWAETKMATTFDVLKPGERGEAKQAAGLDPAKDYTTDVTCLPCHTTGYGKAGGFVDIATTPELAGVGCEMCHGAGKDYIADGAMTLKNKEYKKADLLPLGLVDQVTEAQCTVCHNSKSPFVGDDFVFDFAAKKEIGTHEMIPLKYAH
jgi:hypothetical protein